MRLILPLLLMACAARSGGPTTPTTLDIGPGAPKVCLPDVPDAGRMSKGERARWDAAVAGLREGDVDAVKAALAEDLSHPGLVSLSVIVAVLDQDGEAWTTVAPLIDAWPEDPCLAQVGALAAMQEGELIAARALVDRAITHWPDDPELVLVRALITVQVEGEAAARPLLEQANLAHPDHVGIAFALGVLLLEAGQLEAAIPRFEVARDGGMPLEADLVPLYFHAGRMADYLRAASAQYWPIGDEGAIAQAEDPMAAYLAHLGIEEGQHLVATFDTSMGSISCELHHEVAPVTVANFAGLARGTHPWADPETNEVRKGPIYEETVIHRVIPTFMIQGGDPTGTGSGGPGYGFPDEISEALTFDAPGMLAMANSGPDTNGSQWFITDGPAAWLAGSHTIFGTCDAASQAVVHEIAGVSRGSMDRPSEDVVVHGVEISVR